MGNINCSANNPSGNRFKKMVYSYDLISGKVNDVAYQPGSTDQYFHHYEYDAENRLILVKTSKDKTIWEREAVYDYYRHGPLARVELGQNRVQGLDYAYTLQGWLKGVNSSAVNTATTATNFDMGRDGVNSNGNGNNIVARDAFGFSLNYFSGDYQTVNATVLPFTPVPAILPAQPSSGMVTGSALFNGNIAAMVVNIPQLGAANTYGYRYDQLNRIVRMDAFTGLSNATNSYGTAPVRVEDYHEEITYDPNGNISTYLRNSDSRNRNRNMDNLAYKYNSNSNQLNQVIDAVTDATPADYHDIKTQSANNYGYDKIGNLVSDNSEGISNIDWTVYGKIKSISKTNGTLIKYGYDASGNRISKIVTSSGTGDSTYYVRDASGNTMSVYNKNGATDLLQTELHLYGSSRLGINKVNNNVQNCTVFSSAITSFTRGNKFFELSNHLGNVLATISDKKVSVSSNNTSIDYYKADVMTATDYYPFGMQLPGRNGHAVIIGNINPDGTTNNITNDLTVNSRSGNNPSIYSAVNSITFMDGFATETSDGFETVLGNNPPTGSGSNSANWSSGSSNYRYGFNGKENDNEIKGEGNQQDYGMRIYDPRVGKFLSTDPIAASYPMLTPYQFASNTPIQAIDIDGLEAFFIYGTKSSPDERWIKVRNADGTAKEYYKNVAAIMRLTDNKTINATFQWKNNGFLNSEKDRRSAAERLADYVLKNLKPGEDITLIGQSHGGNVAVQAVGIVRIKLDANEETKKIKINLITVATPAYNGFYDQENPANQPVDNHLHIFNTSDLVQVTLANVANTIALGVPSKTASRTYDNQSTVNYKINVNSEYDYNSIGAHSFDFEFVKFLNNDINAGTLKKVTDKSAPKSGSSPKSYDLKKIE